MTRFYGLFVAGLAMIAVSATARAEMNIDLSDLQTSLLVQTATRAALNWHVGDKASYKLDIGGFIQGTSDSFVRQDTGTDFWMEQDMNISGQQQKIEVMINKSNGQIDKLLVNGQEQAVPKNDTEILDMHADKVSVPAGSFDCVYVKIRDKSNQQITEAWVNPKIVPMNGMLKVLADSQYGKVKEEATSFSFAGH